MRYDVLKISLLNALVFAALAFFVDISYNGGVTWASVEKSGIIAAIVLFTQIHEILKSFKEGLEDDEKPGKKLGVII